MKFITKGLEKFELLLQNSIFANRLRRDFTVIFYTLSDNLFLFAKNCRIRLLLAYKYINGKSRARRFLMDLLDAFSDEHSLLFTMIEFGDVDKNKERYLLCKLRISVLIRANRRFNALVQDNEYFKDLLTEYINKKRFQKKYELQSN
jgi:hypothetical protein